jgi:hypothetical protein
MTKHFNKILFFSLFLFPVFSFASISLDQVSPVSDYLTLTEATATYPDSLYLWDSVNGFETNGSTGWVSFNGDSAFDDPSEYTPEVVFKIVELSEPDILCLGYTSCVNSVYFVSEATITYRLPIAIIGLLPNSATASGVKDGFFETIGGIFSSFEAWLYLIAGLMVAWFFIESLLLIFKGVNKK